VERFYVKFSKPSCNGFRDIVRKHTDRCRYIHPFPATAVGVGKNRLQHVAYIIHASSTKKAVHDQHWRLPATSTSGVNKRTWDWESGERVFIYHT